MADITPNQSGSSLKHAKPRSNKLSVKVDLTPMVDLAFLLISFFMLTTILTEEKSMRLDKRIDTDNTPVGECRVLQVLIDSFDRVYTYEGMEAVALKKTSFATETGIRKTVMDKTKRVKQECGKDAKGNPHQLVCLIKLLPGARYQNMIDIMDEMNITGTALYSMREPAPDEIALVRAKERELLAQDN